jgi:ribosomal protein L3 glutamine methyltransferase
LSPRAPQTAADWIGWAEERFLEADLRFGHGTDNALDEAAWLVGSALDLSPDALESALEQRPTPGQQSRIRTLVDERISTRKPLAYLLKEAWFAGRRYHVDERVIVPRSHLAEFIQERFQPWIAPGRVTRVLDLCTGSGCIAIAVAHAFPAARVDAVDLSPDALAVAAINVEKHAVGNRVALIQSDLYQALAERRYDVIISNPPYVPAWEMRELPAEYRHEPDMALEAGEGGLEIVLRLLAGAPDHLEPGGILLAEVGNSCTALQEALPAVPFLWLTTASGDESVFLLTAKELLTHRDAFARLIADPTRPRRQR